jgi:hypothetical protein
MDWEWKGYSETEYNNMLVDSFNKKEAKVKGDDIDREVSYDNMRQGVEDNCRYTALELSNEFHMKKLRLIKSRNYLEDAMMQIDEVLGQMGDDGLDGQTV